jgi:hypothetical protein
LHDPVEPGACPEIIAQSLPLLCDNVCYQSSSVHHCIDENAFHRMRSITQLCEDPSSLFITYTSLY